MDQLPVDKEGLERLEVTLTGKKLKLEETNEILEEEIRATYQPDQTSSELRSLYEIIQENKDILIELDKTIREVQTRLNIK